MVLGVGLLTEFDSGTADFLDFCSEWFPAQNKQESLARCCREFFEPFKFALAGLVVDGVKEEAPLIGREVRFAHDGLKEQAEHLLVSMVRAVTESSLPESERADLDARDTLMIRALWIGLARALAADKLCPKEIAAVDELLRLYLVAK